MLNRLRELESLALPWMHHAAGTYNSSYRGNKPTLVEAGKKLYAYFKNQRPLPLEDFKSPEDPAEDCLCCQGVGEITDFWGHHRYDCPWCGSIGMVEPEVNLVFRRVDAVMPNTGRMCRVFGNRNRMSNE